MSHNGYPSAVEVARAALKNGPLTRPLPRGHYLSGAKFFAQKTIRQLIANGEAVECGNGVVHIDHIRQIKQAAE